MTGKFTGAAEIVDTGHQSCSEQVMPDPIGLNAGCQHTGAGLRVGQPLAELQPPTAVSWQWWLITVEEDASEAAWYLSPAITVATCQPNVFADGRVMIDRHHGSWRYRGRIIKGFFQFSHVLLLSGDAVGQGNSGVAGVL